MGDFYCLEGSYQYGYDSLVFDDTTQITLGENGAYIKRLVDAGNWVTE